MALNQLSAVKVAQLSDPGRYSDGGGLYLNIRPSGGKSWEYRFQLNKKRRIMGLGSFDKKHNTLAHARERSAEIRSLVGKGIDPFEHFAEIEAKEKADKAKIQAEKEKRILLKNATFKVCATNFIAKRSAEWKNAKHKAQWESSLEHYAYPVLGDMPVNDIDIDHVRACLDGIWLTKTETASRVRQRIEAVISSAIANKQRDAIKGNPAVWKGMLSNFYPRPEKVKRNRHIANGTDGHHPALPYTDLPAFMVELSKLDGFAPLALRFLILTVPRTTELRLAEWPEIDFEKKMWVIPEDRMKAGKRHRIPLSNQALDLLENMPRLSKYIFPGWKKGHHLSDNGLSYILKKMGRTDITVHGFRSTFRDYIGEETGFPDRLAEFALAHQITDEAERAYARGDKLQKRFAMMNAWANYCDSMMVKGSVISIEGRRKKAG